MVRDVNRAAPLAAAGAEIAAADLSSDNLSDLERAHDGVEFAVLMKPFQILAFLLLDHLEGILNYFRTKVRFGVVEAINGDIKTLFRRGRRYKNLNYLLLKARRMAFTKTEFIVLRKAA